MRGGDVLGLAEPGGVLADFDFALASEGVGEVGMATYGQAVYGCVGVFSRLAPARPHRAVGGGPPSLCSRCR
jgi:hypothetical protein